MSLAKKYLMAILFAAVAAVGQAWMARATGYSSFIVLYPAVFLVAWIWGFGPALVTITIGTVAAELGGYTHGFGRLATFLAGTVGISLMVSRGRQSERRAIRELEESQERLRGWAAVLKQAEKLARLGVWMIEIRDPGNFNSNPLVWSDELFRIFGFEPGQMQVTNDLFFGMVPPDDRKLIVDEVARCMAEKLPYNIEHRIIRADGVERILLERAEFTFDETGKPVRLVGAAQDITERKLVEKNLRENETALREAVRARDEFISVASHELKTPLTSMKLISQLMMRKVKIAVPADSTRREFEEGLERQTRQIDRLARSVEDMLDVSRIATGRLSIEPGWNSLSNLVIEVAERFRDSFSEARSSFTLEVQPGIDGNFDLNRLDQVVSNLMSNALKYGLGDRPIEVKLVAEPGIARLSVRDHGPGIPKSEQDRIFNRFERATPNRVSGLGLGLYITRQILQLHGGSVRVESEEGRGACFVVELPLGVPT